jgi:integrase
MARKNTKFPEYPYLTERGNSYRVRVQVPHHLKSVVGKGELIKSFKDWTTVRRKYHETVAGFKAQIEMARSLSSHTAGADLSFSRPSQEDIELACYSYFRRMAASMRGKVAEPADSGGRTRRDRAEGYRLMIENHLDAFEGDAWETMAIQAKWFCEERQWLLREGEVGFEALCRTMLRARLQCYRNELRALEGKMGVDLEVDPLFGNEAPRKGSNTRTLGDLIDKFNDDRKSKWSASTRQNYVIITRVLEEACGRNTPVHDIDRDFCRNVLSILTELPANYQKIPATSGKPIGDAIKIATETGLTTISPATVNTHLNKLGAIIRFGRDEGWIAGNPMAKIEAHDPIHPSEKRDPFSIEQLNQIFSTDPWDGAPPSPVDPRPSRYWVPLIALHTGARLTEICGQRLDEMIEQEGVKLFNFVHRPDRRIKNGISRKTPIHPTLIEIGFWDYVEEARSSGQEFLFSDTRRGKAGKWGDQTSKWFSRKVKALGLRGRCLSMHSFRHSFEDALRRADLEGTSKGNALTGRWTAGSGKNYGNKTPPRQLLKAIEQVSFPDFAFDRTKGARGH